MIKTLFTGNFKAFAETQRIPIRPITLIFGPNSAGKSSFIHSLALAREAERTGRRDGKLRLDRLNHEHPVFREVIKAIVTTATTTDTVSAEDFEGIGDAINNLVPHLSARVTRLFPEGLAEVEFGLDEAELFKVFETHPSLEFCRILATAQAQTFGHTITLSGRHILQGQTYQDLWQERFKLLAKAPLKRVAIVDRYVISQHRECPQGSCPAWNDSSACSMPMRPTNGMSAFSPHGRVS
jgi:hypothetical protein